jgi:hypothetical protein
MMNHRGTVDDLPDACTICGADLHAFGPDGRGYCMRHTPLAR